MSAAVLTRVPRGPSPRAVRLRVAVGAIAVAQGALSLFTLAFHGPNGYLPAAWNLALAAGLATVATRRAHPSALLPLLATLVGVLSWGYVSRADR